MSPAAYTNVEAILALVLICGSLASFWRWGWPKYRRKTELERAKDEVLLGRPAIPANPVTGEPEREAIPGLGDRLSKMDANQEYLIGQVHEAQQTSKQLDRIEQRLTRGDERFDHLEAGLADVVERLK